jgi:metal-responsive CopG/Arc/MetJ family transcriptional regulator
MEYTGKYAPGSANYVYHMAMKRFQIFLPEPLMQRLEKIAQRRDYSVAEIVRSMLERQTAIEEEKDKPCG